MSTLPPLDTINTLLDQGAADSAVRLLRSWWEPELPPERRIRMYCMWIRGLCETGDLRHAVTLAERAASEFPRECDIQIALGNARDIVGDLDGARKAFEAALNLQPGGALQRYNLGAVYERFGDEEKAETCYRQASRAADEGGPMLEATAALGALLRRQGRLDEAEAIYDSYLTEDPVNVELLVEHGICLSDLESYVDAIQRFDTCLVLAADHPGALYNKAITLHRMGRFGDALDTLEGARRVDPENPLTLAVLGSWLLIGLDADLDAGLRMLYRSLELLEQLFGNDPGNAPYCSVVIEEIFEALWQNGRRAEGRDVARVAGQREWITPHILNCLNEADHGRSSRVTAFTVVAEAHAGERPDYWPEDTEGYTTGLAVLAIDENEARELTLQYLRTIDPAPTVEFKLEVVPPTTEPSSVPPEVVTNQPRARGVARVLAHRSYTFRS
ncbi:MAG: tetratricopeptide repeat protein [Nannocystaceae bacterium]